MGRALRRRGSGIACADGGAAPGSSAGRAEEDEGSAVARVEGAFPTASSSTADAASLEVSSNGLGSASVASTRVASTGVASTGVSLAGVASTAAGSTAAGSTGVSVTASDEPLGVLDPRRRAT